MKMYKLMFLRDRRVIKHGILVYLLLFLLFFAYSLMRDNKNEFLLKDVLRPRIALARNVFGGTQNLSTDDLGRQHGPGEGGRAVELTSQLDTEITNAIQANKLKHGFNTYISDLISIHRKIRDKRPKECKEKVYPQNLPQASVVIIFRDEWPSILLRTAYSVLETSPSQLLREIILVDDGSKDTDLKVKVDIHVAAVEKFKLIRNTESEGLMMARQKGIEATSAQYFVVLDGHIEVGPGWLEPLLFRLVQEPNACLTPFVDQIDSNNFHVDIRHRSAYMNFPFFDPLTLGQSRVPYKASFFEGFNKSRMEPFSHGTVQGMGIAMRKQFFLQLGGFDPGMRIWGSEQIELSVKVWMCGGRVEVVPCSGVAHMYR